MVLVLQLKVKLCWPQFIAGSQLLLKYILCDLKPPIGLTQFTVLITPKHEYRDLQ
jgi:hypothetical protein